MLARKNYDQTRLTSSPNVNGEGHDHAVEWAGMKGEFRVHIVYPWPSMTEFDSLYLHSSRQHRHAQSSNTAFQTDLRIATVSSCVQAGQVLRFSLAGFRPVPSVYTARWRCSGISRSGSHLKLDRVARLVPARSEITVSRNRGARPCIEGA